MKLYALMPDEERYFVRALTDGSFWIMDKTRPDKEHGSDDLISTRSRVSADAVCDILNKYDFQRREEKAKRKREYSGLDNKCNDNNKIHGVKTYED